MRAYEKLAAPARAIRHTRRGWLASASTCYVHGVHLMRVCVFVCACERLGVPPPCAVPACAMRLILRAFVCVDVCIVIHLMRMAGVSFGCVCVCKFFRGMRELF